jgi:hypothetical protein
MKRINKGKTPAATRAGREKTSALPSAAKIISTALQANNAPPGTH